MSKKNSATDYTLSMQDQENATSIKLLEQGFEYMKSALDDIKESISLLTYKLENGFVTKEEFRSVKDDVRELQELKGWALKIIVGSVIMGLLALLWSQK
jgi:hypothetical protein